MSGLLIYYFIFKGITHNSLIFIGIREVASLSS